MPTKIVTGLSLSLLLIAAGLPSCGQKQGELHATSAAATDKRNPTTQAAIKVITDPNDKGRGLHVYAGGQIHAKGPEAGKFSIDVVNLTEQEIFLEVTDPFFGVGIQKKAGDAQIPGPGRRFAGGAIMFPDNTKLLKRLHRGILGKDGWTSCGCALATIDGQIDTEFLSKYVGWTAAVSVNLVWYSRSTGERFRERANVLFEIVE
jgi:hypothetical protein